MQRTIEQTIDALTIAAEELRFHASRLAEKREKATADESTHLEDLGKLYSNSARGCDILRRYQEGRLKRSDTDSTPAIDARAQAFAVTEE